MSETKRERYIRILSGLGGADISSEACKELVELLKEQPETAAQTAESAQNVSNEDLISRKAAIDAIYHHLPSVSRTSARTMLHEVPSAQPEQRTEKRTETHACDCISRQAAIDLFPNDALEWDTKGGYIAPHLARRMIEELPSAQPERKKGEWIDLGKDKNIRWQCSECGRRDVHIYNYCPDCGSDNSWSGYERGTR